MNSKAAFPRLIALLAAALPLTAVPASAVSVEVSVDTAEDSARLMLTHSGPIGYVIEPSRGRLKIVYTEPIEMNDEQQRFDGRIFERYRLRDENTLLLYTGRDYGGYESFELRNPFRLVLDMKKAVNERRFERAELPRRTRAETIIVIDPGHGGIEQGAVGPTGLREKDVTLDLARRLQVSLRSISRSVSVVLTRDDDRLLGLDERTAVANHNKAALFLSIHVNSSPLDGVTGAETYYLSTSATDRDAKRLAAIENSSSGDVLGLTGLDSVLWDLAQNEHLARSSALAESLQGQLNQATGTRNRGVRQAPFRVLMGATMPAVLVEVGFISNPSEERNLRTDDYLDRIVNAISRAVAEYLSDMTHLEGSSDAQFGASGP